MKEYFQYQIDKTPEFISFGLQLKDNSIYFAKMRFEDIDFILETLYTNNWNYVIGKDIPIFERIKK